jgi:hypothetical protein
LKGRLAETASEEALAGISSAPAQAGITCRAASITTPSMDTQTASEIRSRMVKAAQIFLL